MIAARLYDYADPKYDHFIGVRPVDLTVYQDWAESKGRHCTLGNREFAVDLYTRLATDDILKDEQWANTHLDYQDDIVNALHIWLPTDSGGNAITACPLHLTTIQHFDKGPTVPGLGISSIKFRCDYILDLSTPFIDPAP